MFEPLHVQVTPLPSRDGWVLNCVEFPDVALQVSTLGTMGTTIAPALAEAAGRPNTNGITIGFDYPLGDMTLFHLIREDDGTISCQEEPGLIFSGASRTRDLVLGIAVATGTPADHVGITFEPSS